MANPVMESRARRIFRDALAMHYIERRVLGRQVGQWLTNHGGWFPDPQEDYMVTTCLRTKVRRSLAPTLLVR